MSDLKAVAVYHAHRKQLLTQQLLESVISIFRVHWWVDFFISSGSDVIQRLEQAQVNSVQFLWTLPNYSEAFLSSFNSVPLLHVIPVIYMEN